VNRSKGFTLLEMMMGVAFFVLVMTVVLPLHESYIAYQIRAEGGR
jgi:Tfp pilus assembly protein PilE